MKQSDINLIAETIWRAESKRATGRDRSESWHDGTSDETKFNYRYLAIEILKVLGTGLDDE